MLNGIALSQSEKIKFISEDGILILTIHDVSRHFDGIVTCQVKLYPIFFPIYGLFQKKLCNDQENLKHLL